MRILWVDNMQIRQYGNLKMGPGRKLVAGAIRNNWRLAEFSDRDVTRYLAPFGIRSIGAKMANQKLITTARNFKPDLLFIGHCDYIRNWALEEIRRILPDIRMAHFNIDPIWMDWHVRQIQERLPVTEAIFITSGGPKLRDFCTGKNVVAYMPNPADPAFEVADNSKTDTFKHDLLFCGKEIPGDFRNGFLREIQRELQGRLRFDIFGMFGNPPVWGADYERVLTESKMSINLNREEDWPLYSSDRIAHLMGSGILTFQSAKGHFQKFFTEREIVFYDGVKDLVEKILYYHTHDEERRAIAAAGRAKYHRIFSGARTLRFMVETLMGTPYSEPYEWADEVYR
ncbi:MAG: glycosyltransferase family 1 protein [Kiritimatiellae bacterium]|nr:glycosyltransferase family 1 protein [Kiritimatiellia bacterium]